MGKPKDGDPRGGYAMLVFNENASVLDAQSIQVEFRCFAYDVEKAAQAVENSPLPNQYAEMLRKAY